MTGKGKGGGEDVSSDRGMLQSSHDPSTARPDPSATLRADVQTTHAENASGRSAQDDRPGAGRGPGEMPGKQTSSSSPPSDGPCGTGVPIPTTTACFTPGPTLRLRRLTLPVL